MRDHFAIPLGYKPDSILFVDLEEILEDGSGHFSNRSAIKGLVVKIFLSKGKSLPKDRQGT